MFFSKKTGWIKQYIQNPRSEINPVCCCIQDVINLNEYSFFVTDGDCFIKMQMIRECFEELSKQYCLDSMNLKGSSLILLDYEVFVGKERKYELCVKRIMYIGEGYVANETRSIESVMEGSKKRKIEEIYNYQIDAIHNKWIEGMYPFQASAIYNKRVEERIERINIKDKYKKTDLLYENKNEIIFNNLNDQNTNNTSNLNDQNTNNTSNLNDQNTNDTSNINDQNTNDTSNLNDQNTNDTSNLNDQNTNNTSNLNNQNTNNTSNLNDQNIIAEEVNYSNFKNEMDGIDFRKLSMYLSRDEMKYLADNFIEDYDTYEIFEDVKVYEMNHTPCLYEDIESSSALCLYENANNSNLTIMDQVNLFDSSVEETNSLLNTVEEYNASDMENISLSNGSFTSNIFNIMIDKIEKKSLDEKCNLENANVLKSSSKDNFNENTLISSFTISLNSCSKTNINENLLTSHFKNSLNNRLLANFNRNVLTSGLKNGLYKINSSFNETISVEEIEEDNGLETVNVLINGKTKDKKYEIIKIGESLRINYKMSIMKMFYFMLTSLGNNIRRNISKLNLYNNVLKYYNPINNRDYGGNVIINHRRKKMINLCHKMLQRSEKRLISDSEIPKKIPRIEIWLRSKRFKFMKSIKIRPVFFIYKNYYINAKTNSRDHLKRMDDIKTRNILRSLIYSDHNRAEYNPDNQKHIEDEIIYSDHSRAEYNPDNQKHIEDEIIHSDHSRAEYNPDNQKHIEDEILYDKMMEDSTTRSENINNENTGDVYELFLVRNKSKIQMLDELKKPETNLFIKKLFYYKNKTGLNFFTENDLIDFEHETNGFPNSKLTTKKANDSIFIKFTKDEILDLEQKHILFLE